MQQFRDDVYLCRCFDAERPLPLRSLTLPARHVRDDQSSALRSDARPYLRPGVDCLQRWIDLNA
jgi:hypothetical protein